jgi:hypothetical protein
MTRILMAGRISKLKERDIGLLGMNEALNVVRLHLMFSFGILASRLIVALLGILWELSIHLSSPKSGKLKQ